jgi:sarcosine oxidase, subunit beta
MTQKLDAIIIGAGITGASIAYELSKKGYKSLNIDKLPAAGHGSTSNTCAIIRTHYSTLEGTAIAYDSYFYWKNWKNYLKVEDEMGLAKFREVGMVILTNRDHENRKYTKLNDRLGIPYELWDREKLLQRMPHFVADSFHPPKRPEDPSFDNPSNGDIHPESLYYPQNGYINDPILSVHNVQRAAESNGAQFLFNAEVVEIRKNENGVIGITTKDNVIVDAPIVVNASGPHSFIVNQLAGVEDKMRIKTRALRHEVHFVPSPEEFSYETDGLVVGDLDLAGYHRPETGNMVLVGSEDPECDEKEWIENPDDYNQELTDAQWKAQVYRLAKRIPSLPILNNLKGIVDLYDVSDDWIPIYDKSDLAGFYLAIGTSGNQYKNGPTIGQLMTHIIESCQNGHDHDSHPVQVKLRNIDFTINTGFFSRNRNIIEGSSFSVLG